MTIETLIFDLDGTISDPSEGISNSVNYALVRHGHEAVSHDRVRRLIGPPLPEIFEALVGTLPEDTMLELVSAYRDCYAETGYRENVLYDGIVDVIASLSESGYRMGVCTSKREDYATKIVEMFGLLTYFDFVDGGDIHIKKYMQLESLVGNGLDASRSVMIGDRAVDIEAGQRSSMRTVAVTWGFAEPGELADANPDGIACAPEELLEQFP